MKVAQSIKSLCSPALLYLVLSVVGLISMISALSLTSIAVKSFFILLWTWFLDFLCRKGHTGISWFLVLLPFIFMLLILFFALDAVTAGSRRGWTGYEGFTDEKGSDNSNKSSDTSNKSFWSNFVAFWTTR